MSSTLRGALSTVPQGQIIDFDKAELRRLPFQDSLYLWVKGRLPASGYSVRLAPRLYKDGRPEYWAIDVSAFNRIAVANGSDGRSDTDNSSDNDSGTDDLVFERSVPLSGIIGTKGVTVIGANRSQRIEIDGEAF